ncbi:hypothetical protein [uncultured Corynebacterium sp.]|uniref:hypothetical protein n=1 Tax=uncultured Corynebacterium sp. TaxID=159447 RepID=UPI0026379369|nr:hypothetical protein [uncultured Corynebacterium sp.]
MTVKNTRVPHVEKKSVAMASGIVLFSVVTGTIAGLAWAFLRPMQQVQILDNDQLAVVQETVDAGFIGMLWFVAVTAVSGLALGIAAFRKRPITSPVQMLTAMGWAGFSALMSSAVTYIVGQSVATLRQPDLSALMPGEMLSVIPDFTAYVALLVAPLVAMLALWSRVLFQEDFAEGNDSSAADATEMNNGTDGAAAAAGTAPDTTPDSATK